MKKKWVLAFYVFFALAIFSTIAIAVAKQSQKEPSALQLIDTAKLTTMLQRKDDMVIVDLREPELYGKERVPGSINIPFESIQQRFAELPRDKKIVFVCHTGRMGTESGNLLISKGYKEVYNLEGGMAKWTGALER